MFQDDTTMPFIRKSRSVLAAWLLPGLCFAAGLCASSIFSYRPTFHGAAVDEARLDLAARVAPIERALLGDGMQIFGRYGALLEAGVAGSGGKIVYLKLRDANGAVIAIAGTSTAPTSSPPTYSYRVLRDRFRNNEPVFATVLSPVGPLVVEVFPMCWTATNRRPALLVASYPGTAESPKFGSIEAAAPLAGVRANPRTPGRTLLVGLLAISLFASAAAIYMK
jgi:hypothetical protein